MASQPQRRREEFRVPRELGASLWHGLFISPCCNNIKMRACFLQSEAPESIGEGGRMSGEDFHQIFRQRHVAQVARERFPFGCAPEETLECSPSPPAVAQPPAAPMCTSNNPRTSAHTLENTFHFCLSLPRLYTPWSHHAVDPPRAGVSHRPRSQNLVGTQNVPQDADCVLKPQRESLLLMSRRCMPR